MASRRQGKIKRWRLNHFGQEFSRFSSPRWVKIGEIGGITALFLANLWLLWPFFGQENRVNVFSAPIIPILVNLTERVIDFPHGVRLWLLVFLSFSPLSFYYFTREVSGRKLVAFLSSLMTILPVGFFLPVRTALGFLAEDGGHIASLAFSPLVCLLLLRFLRKGHFWTGIWTALGATLIGLTSPIGLMVLGIFMGVIVFSEILLGQGRLKIIRFLVILILLAGFSSFWYHPRFAILILQSSQGQLVRKTLANLLPVSFFLVPILGVFGFLLFENRPQLQPMFIASFLTVGFGLFSLGAGIAYPVPSRFLPAFGLALAFLIGLLALYGFDFLRFSLDTRLHPALSKLRWFKAIVSRRQLIAFGMMGLAFTSMILVIVFFGRGWQIEQTQALDFTSEQKGGIWAIRGETSQTGNIFGYVISGLTVLGVGILGRRMRNLKFEKI